MGINKRLKNYVSLKYLAGTLLKEWQHMIFKNTNDMS